MPGSTPPASSPGSASSKPQAAASPVAAAVVAAIVAAILAAAITYLAVTALASPGPDAAASPAGGGGGPGGGAGGPGQGGPPPALVRLGEATLKQVQQRTRIVGQLTPVQEAIVAAEVEGRVTAMPIDVGDRVVAGETVLAEVDEVFTQLELDAAEAEVLAAEATLAQAESDLEELESLARRNSATEKEVNDQRAQVKADRARLQASIAVRDRFRERVQRLKVVAPFDGVVTEKLTEVGQWLAPGASVARVVSRGRIDAEVDIPERFINAVEPGMAIAVLIEPLGNRRVEGEVVSINPRGASAARTFPVEVRLSDQGGELKPGMSVIAEVPLTGEAQRLTVPRDAVQFSETGATVWAGVPMGESASATPSAVPMPVRVLFGSGPDFVIEALPSGMGPPLSAGTPVVIEGAERLFPTQPLKAMGDDAGPTESAEDGESERNPDDAAQAS